MAIDVVVFLDESSQRTEEEVGDLLAGLAKVVEVRHEAIPAQALQEAYPNDPSIAKPGRKPSAARLALLTEDRLSVVCVGQVLALGGRRGGVPYPHSVAYPRNRLVLVPDGADDVASALQAVLEPAVMTTSGTITPPAPRVPEAPKAAPARVRAPLRLDLKIHLVQNARDGGSADQSILEQANEILKPAGIELHVREWSTTPLSDEVIESFLPNVAGTRTSRVPSFAALEAVPQYDRQLHNLFIVKAVRVSGATLTQPVTGASTERTLVLGQKAGHKLAWGLALQCGLKTVPEKERLMGGGTTLTEEECELLRQGAIQRGLVHPEPCEPAQPLLLFPIKLHCVRNARDGATLSMQRLEAMVAWTNEVFRPAGIVLEVEARSETELSDDLIADILPGSSPQYEKLKALPEFDPSSYNVFCFKSVRVAGKDLVQPSAGRGLLLVSERVPKRAGPQCLAWGLATQLGLTSVEGHPDRLMSKAGATGTRLAPDEIERLRNAVKELVVTMPAPSSPAPPKAAPEPAKAPPPAVKLEPVAAKDSQGLLEVPVQVTRVENPLHGTARSEEEARALLDRVNAVWEPAGIRFQPTFHTRKLGPDLENAFPNSPKADTTRKPDPSVFWTVLDRAQVNVVLLRDILELGLEAPERRDSCNYPTARLALLADQPLRPEAKLLARGLGLVLGLENSEKGLMAYYAPDIDLTKAEVQTARTRAAELLRPPAPPAEAQPIKGLPGVNVSHPPPNDRLEDALAELEALVGLQAVKAQVNSLVNHARIETLRRQRGMARNPLFLNAVVAGMSGTGKTTVARLLGRLYRGLGILPGGQVVEATRAALTGSEDNFKQVLALAEGGVLLVDDAPTLGTRKKEDAAGKTAVAALLCRLEEDPERMAVILSGWPDEMPGFLEAYPALAARFRHRLEFPHCSAEELLAVFEQCARTRGFVVTPEAHDALGMFFADLARQTDRSFANARTVHSLFEESLERQANRLVSSAGISEEDLVTLEAQDMPRGHRKGNEPPGGDSLEKVLEELNALVGLARVKEQVRRLCNFFTTQKARREQGLSTTPLSLHMAFLGPPGTGKTTVARMMGRIFKCLGLLGRGHVIETDRSGLVASYVGQTAPKTNEAVDSALHGVLFVDEAYMLAARTTNDLAPEAVATLVKRMEDSKDKLCVIVAGYTSDMQAFFDVNAGLRSRFPHQIEFEDYKPAELLTIFEGFCASGGYRLDPEARAELARQFEVLYNQRGSDFGNGRLVRNVFEKCVELQASRLSGAPGEDLSLLVLKDVPLVKSSPARGPAGEAGAVYAISDPPALDSLEDALRDLNGLIGLENVKERIRSLVNLMQVSALRGETTRAPMNLIFSGGPGTGKTTVARSMGRIYRCLGLLARGHLLETDQSGLISGFVGGSAKLVNQVFDRCVNGVLFIDEAYALSESEKSGPEVVSAIVKRMEDLRDKVAVVLAGYTTAMEEFLLVNAGLRSRFLEPIEFPDYKPEELVSIFGCFAAGRGMTLEAEAADRLLTLFGDLYRGRDETFGNGRLARQVFDDVVQRQANRIGGAGLTSGLDVLLAVDVPEQFGSAKGKRELGLRQRR